MVIVCPIFCFLLLLLEVDLLPVVVVVVVDEEAVAVVELVGRFLFLFFLLKTGTSFAAACFFFLLNIAANISDNARRPARVLRQSRDERSAVSELNSGRFTNPGNPRIWMEKKFGRKIINQVNK